MHPPPHLSTVEITKGSINESLAHPRDEPEPGADCQRELLLLEHTELPCLVEWQLLLGAVLSDE
jgi:hypothetical protein